MDNYNEQDPCMYSRVPGLSNTGLSNTANFRNKEHSFEGLGTKNTL